MNCVQCSKKECRVSLEACGAEAKALPGVKEQYHEPYEQKIVQAAASLVDNGRAGTLSRLEEIAEFGRQMGYAFMGIAYCYAMEKEAAKVRDFLREKGFKVSAVACTLGAFLQDEINETSTIHNVSCNPILQAEQLNREHPELVITMGLCLGHDILFNKYIQTACTNLVVKDRTTGHNPLEAINKI